MGFGILAPNDLRPVLWISWIEPLDSSLMSVTSPSPRVKQKNDHLAQPSRPCGRRFPGTPSATVRNSEWIEIKAARPEGPPTTQGVSVILSRHLSHSSLLQELLVPRWDDRHVEEHPKPNPIMCPD